jgi:hypothetical protein
MTNLPTPGRIAALTGYAALGPITGPLVAGAIRNFRQGDHLLAGLYVLAVPLSYYLMMSAAMRLTHLL